MVRFWLGQGTERTHQSIYPCRHVGEQMRPSKGTRRSRRRLGASYNPRRDMSDNPSGSGARSLFAFLPNQTQTHANMSGSVVWMSWSFLLWDFYSHSYIRKWWRALPHCSACSAAGCYSRQAALRGANTRRPRRPSRLELGRRQGALVVFPPCHHISLSLSLARSLFLPLVSRALAMGTRSRVVEARAAQKIEIKRRKCMQRRLCS